MHAYAGILTQEPQLCTTQYTNSVWWHPDCLSLLDVRSTTPYIYITVIMGLSSAFQTSSATPCMYILCSVTSTAPIYCMQAWAEDPYLESLPDLSHRSRSREFSAW